MNTKYIIGIILVLIVILGIITFYVFKETSVVYKETYEVNDEHDNVRTFVVYNNGVLIGFGNENGSWADLQLSPSYSFGVKFNNITIPKGAEIKTAYIELYSVGAPGDEKQGIPGNDHPCCKIYCDDTDNAVNFSEKGVLNITGRIYTENYTLWNETVKYGEWIKTPSVIPPIQEIVNRGNWTSGNSVAFLFVTEGIFGYSATFKNFENGYPAKLYIEWA